MKIVSLADITLDSSDVAASSYNEYASGTTYADGDNVKVSFESDGTTPRTPVEEYESLTGSNTGNYPPDSPTEWSLIGASNRWKMFDSYTNTQTENTTSIEVEIDSSSSNAVGLFNLVAKEVTLAQIVETEKVTDGDCSSDSADNQGTGWSYGAGNEEYDCDGTQTADSELTWDIILTEDIYYQVVFTVANYSAGNVAGIAGGTSGTNVSANGTYTQIIQAGSENKAGVIADSDFVGSIDDVSVKKVPSYETIDLITMVGSGWYYYLFSDVQFTQDLIWEFSRYSDSTLRITITYYTGSTAKCGMVAIGSSIDLGNTQYGVSLGIIDYSQKDTDTLGRTYLNQGDYAKRADISLWIDNTDIDSVRKNLAAVRGTASIFECNNEDPDTDYTSLLIYGFYREFDIIIPGPVISKCNIDIEGLI